MGQNQPQIHFYFLDRTSLQNRNLLKQFLVQLFKKEKKLLRELSYIFCSDNYLLNINQSYLKHDEYTDIITFNLSDHHKQILGEVYISTDRIRDNAKKFNTSFYEELHRVIFHGALHLCGFNDKTPSEKEQMIQKENYYLGKYNEL